MQIKQVSDNCVAVLTEKNRVCDANSGLINRAGGVVIDTQADLAHARQMIELFSKVWPAMPKRGINTREDGDHVWGNQLFEGAEIIAHKSVPERMKHVANPEETQTLLHGVELVLPTTLFDTRYEVNLDGTEVHLIYVAPCHQVGDRIGRRWLRERTCRTRPPKR